MPLKIKLACAMLVASSIIFLLISLSDLSRGITFTLLGGVTFLALGIFQIVSSIAIIRELKYAIWMAISSIMISAMVVLLSSGAVQIKLILLSVLVLTLSMIIYTLKLGK